MANNIVADIVDGISKSIGDSFGTDYRIYTENIEQGLHEPCFFIKVLNPSQAEFIGNRWKQTVPVDIHYYPNSKTKNAECHTTASQLWIVLKRINLLDGTMMNGWDMHYEIVDNVMHFFVIYKPIIRYIDPEKDKMQTISIDQKVKT